MLERPDSAANFGGEQVHLARLCEGLEALGVTIVRSCDPEDVRTEFFDLVHLWNVQHPFEALAFVERLAGSSIPLALTPVYNDLRRALFSLRVQEHLAAFQGQELEDELRAVLEGRSRFAGPSTFCALPIDERILDAQRQVLQAVDLLLPLSVCEAESLYERTGILPPFVQVNHVAPQPVASPDLFLEAFSISEPFVLLPAARIEPNKNQWLSLLALSETAGATEMPIYVTGEFCSKSFELLCRRDAPAGTQFVGLLPKDLHASALAAAELVVHASVIECASLCALDAAAAGTALIVGHTGSEPEYFQDHARIVPALDMFSIRAQAMDAVRGGPRERERRKRLQEHVKSSFSWERSCRQVRDAYLELREAAPLRLHG